MRYIVLLFAWITPAIIAESLGWHGILDSGRALTNYLMPIPVGAGVLHIPSFAIAAAVILTLKKWPASAAQWVPLVALAVLLFAQTMQLELDNLNAWLFTDVEPASAVVGFEGNPLLLFIATDAFWVTVYAVLVGHARTPRYILLWPLVPAIVIGMGILVYKTDAPDFSYGFSIGGNSRGDETFMIYTRQPLDESMFRNWLETSGVVGAPWDSVNAGHQAVLFTRSMQAIKSASIDDEANIVATICRYEEDRSTTVYSGFVDCFTDRLNFNETLALSQNNTSTGLGSEVDEWYAQAKLCDGVQIPENYQAGIEVIDWCRRLRQDYPDLIARLSGLYGEDSVQVGFVLSHAGLVDAN